jgi:hypothetical protein
MIRTSATGMISGMQKETELKEAHEIAAAKHHPALRSRSDTSIIGT